MAGYVLIVDDNQDARDVFGTVLNFYGLETKIAATGEQALAFARQQAPDLILLGLMMPEMSGFQVIVHLRSDTATRKVPIVVISACGMNSNDIKNLPGVTHVIPKEKFNVSTLKEVVSETLGRDLQAAR